MALKCTGKDSTTSETSHNDPYDVSSGNFFRRFLLDRTSPLHRYYRWKVFTLCQGDEQFRWMLNQDSLIFRMESGGPLWESPKIDALALRLFDREQSEIRARKEKQRALPAGSFLASRDKDMFLKLLGKLTLERNRINEAMCFALARAYAAPDLVATIVSHAFFEDARTPAPTMISHLYLVSDLLHNSGSVRQHASTLRTHIEAHLPTVFGVMGKALRGITGRLSANAMEMRVEKVLLAWDKWGVWTTRFVEQLRSLFKGDSRSKKKAVRVEGVDGQDGAVAADKTGDGSVVRDSATPPPRQQEDSLLDGEAFDPDDF